MIKLSLFFCASICALALCCHFAYGSSQTSKFSLARESFELLSALTWIDKNGFTNRIELEELYSFEQKRAKLHLKNLNGNRKNFYFHNKFGLEFDELTGCKLTTIAELNKELYGEYEELMEEMLPTNSSDFWVIGPTRLLFLLADNSDRFTRQLYEGQPKIRNHPIDQFTFEIDLPTNRVAKFTVSYDKIEGFDDGSKHSGVPMSVMVQISSMVLFIDYYKHQILASSQPRWPKSSKIIDLFAYPIGFACSQLIGSSTSKFSRPLGVYKNHRFSFTAISNDRKNYRPYRNFVAVDSLKSLVRIDTNNIMPKYSHNDKTTILDLRINRKYILKDQTSSTKNASKDRSRVETIIMINSPSISTLHLNSVLDEYLLGATDFYFLGRAVVRGIDALIYETKAKNLPPWFVNQVLVTDRNGTFYNYERSNPLKELSEPDKSELTIVIYVTANTAEFLLLLMEAYLFGESRSRERVFEAAIYDFQWSLNDSPSGVKQSYLFNRIQSSSGLENEPDRVYHANVMLGSSKQVPNQPIPSWVSDPKLRNDALELSLLTEIDARGTMMLNFESHMKKNGQSIIINSKFDLHLHPTIMSKVFHLGRAKYNPSYKFPMLQVEADSLEDCLRYIDTSVSRAYIYHRIQTETCVIDTANPIGKAPVFVINPDGMGNLFLVENHRDQINCLRNSWLVSNNLEHLNKRQIALKSPVNVSDDYLRLDMMKIDVKAKNFKFLPESGNDVFLDELTEFAYAENDENKWELIIDPGKKQLMTFGFCEAACLNDLNCGSFMFCSVDSSCILSKLGFKISSKSLRKQLDRIHYGKDQTDFVVVDTKDKDGNFKLRSKIGCSIHNKDYKSLFIEGMKVERSLNFVEISAGTRDECAFKCFNRTLYALRQSSTLNKQLSELFRQEIEFSKSDIEVINKLNAINSQVSSNICSKFHYLDSELSKQQRFDLRKLLENTSTLDNNTPLKSDAKLCFIEIKAETKNTEKTNKISLPLESFEFDFSKLFEKMLGFQLKSSSLDSDLFTAYMKIDKALSLQLQDYEALRKARHKNKNLVIRSYKNLLECSKSCIELNSRFLSGCKSFDLAVNYFNPDVISTVCHLNTISIIDDVVEENFTEHSGGSKLIHFEPKFVQMLASLDNELVKETLIEFQLDNIEDVSRFLLTSVVLSGITSGLILGLLFGRRIAVVYPNKNDDDDMKVKFGVQGEKVSLNLRI